MNATYTIKTLPKAEQVKVERRALLGQISLIHFDNVPTLYPRGSQELDTHVIGVDQLRRALKDAFEAGREFDHHKN